MNPTTVFHPERVRQLQRELDQVAEASNLLRQQINGKVNSWSSDLPIWESLYQVQQSIARLTSDADQLTEVVRRAIEGIEKIEQENKRGAATWWDSMKAVTSLLVKFGQQGVSRLNPLLDQMRQSVHRWVDKVQTWHRSDAFEKEAIVQQLREKLASVNLAAADRI